MCVLFFLNIVDTVFTALRNIFHKIYSFLKYEGKKIGGLQNRMRKSDKTHKKLLPTNTVGQNTRIISHNFLLKNIYRLKPLQTTGKSDNEVLNSAR